MEHRSETLAVGSVLCWFLVLIEHEGCVNCGDLVAKVLDLWSSSTVEMSFRVKRQLCRNGKDFGEREYCTSQGLIKDRDRRKQKPSRAATKPFAG